MTIPLKPWKRDPLSLVMPFRMIPMKGWNIGFMSNRQPQMIAMSNSKMVQIKFNELLTAHDISTRYLQRYKRHFTIQIVGLVVFELH